MKKIATFIVLIFAVVAIVWHKFVEASPSPVPNTMVVNCPNVNDVKRNTKKQTWFAKTTKGEWKSYDTSFATDLVRFMGAQWTGEAFGQVTCVYQSEQRFKMDDHHVVQPTFPVLLVYHTLSYQPHGGRWKYVKPGVYNCYSLHRDHCQFIIRVKKKEGDIYKEAESLKYQKQNQLQGPSY